MFAAQVLSADGSCPQAVDAAALNQLIAGLQPGSTDTGAYCRARARLSLALVSVLARELPGWWPWRGRQVRVVDGAIVSLADTAAI